MTGQQQNINLPDTQPSFIAALMKLVPCNQLGLPEGIYRPDLLPAPPGKNPQVDKGQEESSLLASTSTPTSATNSENVSRRSDSDASGGKVEQERDAVESSESSETESKKGDIETPQVSTESPTHPGSDLPCRDSGDDTLLVPAPFHSQAQEIQLALNDHPEVKAAYVPLSYLEGFPTLYGVPFWVQLPFEDFTAYKCFDLYLRQGRSGARQIYILSEDKQFPENVTDQELHDFSETYFWAARTKSYDMFSAAHRRKEREQRAISTENEHYLLAERLMKIAECYLTEQGDELAEMMTPKMLLEFVKTSTQLQRISAGLPATGPSPHRQEQNGDAPHGESTSLEIIMRSIAKETGASKETEIVDTSSEHKSKLREIMKDEDAIGLAQELVLKLNNPKNVKVEMETV